MEPDSNFSKVTPLTNTSNGKDKVQMVEYKTYKRRFYTLLVFSLFGMFQYMMWNTWAAVSATASVVLHWDITILALLPQVGQLLSVLSIFPIIYIIIRFGLRVALLHCALLSVLATGLRCIPCNSTCRIANAMICAVIGGYVGALTMLSPTLFSAVWFPLDERTKATSFMYVMNNNVGAAMAFLLPQLIVKYYNITDDYEMNETAFKKFAEMESSLNTFLLIEFGISVVLCLSIAIYFPKEPPTPPSTSITTVKISFLNGTTELFKSYDFVLVFVAYSFMNGFFNSYMSIFDEILQPIGVPQSTSNLISFLASLTGIPSGLVISSLADYNKKWMKGLLVLCLFGSGIGIGIFALMAYGLIFSLASVYATNIIGAFFANAAFPLFYEYGCEVSYPVSEETVTGLLTLGQCGISCLVLGIVALKLLGDAWVTVGMALSFLIIVPFIILRPARYRRHEIDKPTDT